MKKLLTALAAALLLVGCAPEPVLIQLPQRYEIAGRLRYQGIETQVALRRDGRDILEFESPAGLRGLSVTADQSFADFRYAGLERRFTRGSLPADSVAALLLEALDTAADTGVPVSGQYEDAGGQFTLTMDKGNILKLSIPGKDLELEVHSFRNLDQNT